VLSEGETVGKPPVPPLEPLPVVELGRGYGVDTVGVYDGVDPVPDNGSVSLEPCGVPVGPAEALPLVIG
jgi:hypothetical protein